MISIIQAAGWPIWPLLACSILALTLVFERFLSLRATKIAPPQVLEELMSASLSRVLPPEVLRKAEAGSLLGRVLTRGLAALAVNPQISQDDLRSVLENAGREAAHELERYLPALATIASAAPLLGLLGTVIGMIEIFGAQNAAAVGAGSGDPLQVAQGISIALYNTAFGLIVAIPALMFWRYFRSRVDTHVLQLELASERFARHLNRLRQGG